jgi:hypothetical protein
MRLRPSVSSRPVPTPAPAPAPASAWRLVPPPLALISLLAVTACPTVDLGEMPPAAGLCRPPIAYYQDVVWPEFLAPSGDTERSCVAAAGCHQRDNGRSALRLLSAEPLSAADHQQNYDVVTRFLNCGTPEASTLLTKPLSGVDPHGGGDLVTPGDAPEEAFLTWFEQ